MFHNYFFLKRLANSLNGVLPGMQLLECFSQNKDELILGFASENKALYIRANLDPQISLLDITDDFRRARKNSVDLFEELIKEEVSGVEVFQYERSFSIRFMTGLQLIFKMHASRSNILLANDEKVISLFRNNLPNDLEIEPSTLNKHLDLSKDRFQAVEGNPKAFIPALGKEVNKYLTHHGYFEAGQDHQWAIIQAVLQQLETAPIRIYQGELPQLSLLEEELPVLLETTDAIAASHEFYYQYSRTYYVFQARQQASKPLEADIKKTESYLSKTQQKLEAIRNRRGYDEIANILMANLHQIPKGSKSVTLDDFYSEKPITIKLNPELTPQKNAENLYRKAKNQQMEINKLEENLAVREGKLLEMMQQLEELQAAENVKDIRQLRPREQQKKQEIVHLPYHEYEHLGYKIMVGKNAKHNDELTLKVANKDDLWLHAKDVAGSHVVVRHQAGKPFPKPVIERAAELAAWFSKRKTDSLCPVIFTPKKFVRKRKGDPAGAVVVEKEEVLMVEPKR